MGKERQLSKTLEGIRADHLARYLFACERIPRGSYVIDIACGCGYGSYMMEKAGLKVTGVDICQEAIDHAQNYFKGPTYFCQKAEDTKGSWNAIVSFETLEHLADPESLLKRIKAPLLVASVPNEEVIPFSAANFSSDQYPHLRHYRPSEFEEMLGRCGFKVKEWGCQPTKESDVKPGTDGMFIVVVATR